MLGDLGRQGVRGHVRAADRCRVARRPGGDRGLLRGDGPTSAAGLDPGRRLATPARGLPTELRRTGPLDLDDCSVGGSHVRALNGGITSVPRRKPRRLYADRGYDFDKYRRQVWKRGIEPLIARRGVTHGSGVGKVRRVVGRAFAWLHRFKRLRIRYERRADPHQDLLELACGLTCLRRLRTSS